MGSKVYLYHAASGKQVITEFINKLDPHAQARIRNALRLLTEYGFDTSAGHSIKKLSSNPALFELRVKSNVQIRLLFTCPDRNIFFVVHIFIKKTTKTPLKELILAKKRAQEIKDL